MTFVVIPVRENDRTNRVILVDVDQGHLHEVLEPEGVPVRAHPAVPLQDRSLHSPPTLRAAVESLLENSTAAQAMWSERSDADDLAGAAAEADHLLAPNGMVSRELDEVERAWRSGIAMRHQEMHLIARSLPETPVREVTAVSRELGKLVQVCMSLVDELFERPLRPRIAAELEAELNRVSPETQLRDLDLDRDSVEALAMRSLFTVQDARESPPTELRSILGAKPLRVVQAALRSLDGDGEQEDEGRSDQGNHTVEGWSRLPSRIRNVMEKAGYHDLESLSRLTLAEARDLPGMGPKGMEALETQMIKAGVRWKHTAIGSGQIEPKSTGSQVLRGAVAFFNPQRGFGFLSRDDGGDDIFVHQSDLRGSFRDGLHEGEKVEFEVATGRKGPKAKNVRILG